MQTNNGKHHCLVSGIYFLKAQWLSHCCIVKCWEVVEHTPLGEPTIVVKEMEMFDLIHSSEVICIPVVYHACDRITDDVQQFNKSPKTCFLQGKHVRHNSKNPLYKLAKFAIHSSH